MTANTTKPLAYAAIGALSPITAALACRTIPGIPAVALTAAGAVLAGLTFAIARRKTTTAKAVTLSIGIAAAALWATIAAVIAVTPIGVVVLLMGVVIISTVLLVLPNPPTPAETATQEAAAIAADPNHGLPPGRTRQEEDMQALIRRLSKTNLTVERIEPWGSPTDGMDIHIGLVDGMIQDQITELCTKLQTSPQMRLPRGCLVSQLASEYQSEAIIRVMLRDCLTDYIELGNVETSEPASINDTFPLIRSPQGSWFKVCLRIACMIVGGTTGSGKTTLLDRIIAYLARCTDALIWVVDFNGGGLGANWTRAYEEGIADRPIVDWLGDTEEESAVILAAAKALAKSRKTDKESVAMRKAAKNRVLPITKDKPAIVVITDEGGEVKQAASLLGQIVCANISSLAQIGRESGVRVVMSVLRGTADLLDKALRAVCSIRVCLRMDEEGEYDHVLGRNPGRLHLMHTGSAWIYRTTKDARPMVGRSVDVTTEFIERHSVACAHLRPTLDIAGQKVLANLNLWDVFGGKDPENYPDILKHPALVDVAEGNAYTNRHVRRANKLAESGSTQTLAPERPKTSAPAAPSSAVEGLLAAVNKQTSKIPERTAPPAPAPVREQTEDEVFAALTAGQHFLLEGHNPADTMWPDKHQEREAIPEGPTTTLREHVNTMLTEIYPDGMRAGEIETQLQNAGVRYSRGNLFAVLKDMVGKHGEVDKEGDRYFHRPLV